MLMFSFPFYVTVMNSSFFLTVHVLELKVLEKNMYFDSFLREIRVKMSNDTVHKTFDVQKNA